MLALAVLWLHLWLLGLLLWRDPAAAPPPAAVAAPAPLLVARVLPPPMSAQAPPQPAQAPPHAAAVPPAGPARPSRAATAVRALASTHAGAAAASPRPLPPRASGEAAQAAAATPAAAQADTLAMAVDSAKAPLPVYATRLPANVSLHYRAQRGDALGSAQVQWEHGADGAYWLRLDTAWPGQPAAGSVSRGQIDRHGVAPLRHAEIRRARELRAANFQRDAALITFSGPQRSYPLPPGAQDRLSWMVQLAAIVAADAGLRRSGERITLFVAGTRGDADAWHFEVLGAAPLQLPAGTVADALQLRREPARPYDTRVEVWLDPARQHLPVRLRLTTLPGGQPLQLDLDRAPMPHSALEIGAPAPR